MAVPRTYIPGTFSGIAINGITLPVTKITINHTIDDLETTSTQSGGFDEFQSGNQRAQFTVDANWDASLHPGTAPLDVQNGAVVGPMTVWLKSTTMAPLMTSSFVKIGAVKTDIDPKGIIKYTLDAKTSGSFTLNNT